MEKSQVEKAQHYVFNPQEGAKQKPTGVISNKSNEAKKRYLKSKSKIIKIVFQDTIKMQEGKDDL